MVVVWSFLGMDVLLGRGGEITCEGLLGLTHGGGRTLGVTHGGGSNDRIVGFFNLIHCWKRVWDYSPIHASLSTQEQFVTTISDINHLPG